MSNLQSSRGKKDICIVIPTFRRSEGLEEALKSLFLQNIMSQNVRVLVVDNNPEPIEKRLTESLSSRFNHNIEYVHEAKAGVSNARNAAMKLARTSRYIAFLDDDMLVSPDWLSALVKTSKDYKAGLVFGPTYAVMPNEDDPCNDYMSPFYERIIYDHDEGYTEETLGTGGCLIDLDYCNLPIPPFDPALNERGGEDDIFFDHLRQTGTRIAWSPKAASYEIVPETRATHDYIWKRNFGYGQGPARIHAARGIKGIPKILYFMTTGTIQLALYAPILAVQKLLNRPAQSKYLALTARAMGKIFWQDKFSPLLYGNAAS